MSVSYVMYTNHMLTRPVLVNRLTLFKTQSFSRILFARECVSDTSFLLDSGAPISLILATKVVYIFRLLACSLY